MSFEYLLELIHNYSIEDKEMIIRAYEYAKVCHKGVKRKSGEPYIIHPLAVACILAEMHADADTIAAGLLHDVLEDCPAISKEDIAKTFNPTVANLVDGVTKLKKINFNNDENLTDAANLRKIMESIIYDVRSILIRLADRLHNMRTENFQPPEKQQEHSRETKSVYVPFARLTGAYKLMCELEDLSFSYLDPQEYQKMDELIGFVRREYEEEKEHILIEISQMLNSNKIPFNIKTEIKGRYELHRKLLTYGSYKNIHDLYGIRILLDNVEDCYSVKRELELMFKYLQEKEKDYIKHPKTNFYQSLHTSIISPNGFNFQFQINTNAMQQINNYGLTAYWRILRGQRKEEIAKAMQKDVMRFPFFSTLVEYASPDVSNETFVKGINEEILNDKVYITTPKKEVIELPAGSTPIDLAYKLHTNIGNTITGALVNGERVPLDYQLKTKDSVQIEYDLALLNDPNRPDLSSMCKTKRAQRKIREHHKTLAKIPEGE